MLLSFSSCEKTVKLNVKANPKDIVVEGYIENGELPYVILTRAVGFFDKIDFSSIQFVSGAQVVITDITAQKSITLRQYDIDSVIGGKTFRLTAYAPDFNDSLSVHFKGIEEHLYRLHIEADGKSMEGVTKIPTAYKLDSLWFEPVPGKEGIYDALKGLYPDPDTFGNTLKYQTKNNKYVKTGEPEIFYDSFNFAYDDAIINGTKFTITFDLGYDHSQTLTGDDLFNQAYAKKGDTITLKCSSMDYGTYKFWSTLNIAQNSSGNPFATPLKVQGNVQNAIGVWGGYGTTYYHIIDSLK